MLWIALSISSSLLLWAGGVLIAVGLLAASINRRRTGLVETLREFVKRQLPADEDVSDESTDS